MGAKLRRIGGSCGRGQWDGDNGDNLRILMYCSTASSFIIIISAFNC